MEIEDEDAQRFALARGRASLTGHDRACGTGAHAGRDTRLQPQVVLLDLNLPRLGGLDVLERIRADARTRLLPVVVLTSSKEDEDLINSYSKGANAYVRKPVDFAEFLEAVKTLGLFWLVLNEPAPRRETTS